MKKLGPNFRRKWNYSLFGLFIALKEERSLLVYIGFFSIIIGIGIYAKLSYLQWTTIVLCFGISLAIEMINTALEATVDMISFQYNLKVKKIKDIASASAFIMGLSDIIIVVLIFVSAFTGVI